MWTSNEVLGIGSRGANGLNDLHVPVMSFRWLTLALLATNVFRERVAKGGRNWNRAPCLRSNADLCKFCVECLFATDVAND